MRYDPSELKKLYCAFDNAWASIEPDVPSKKREDVRIVVGRTIMGLAGTGHWDVQQLANYAAYSGRAYLDLRS